MAVLLVLSLFVGNFRALQKVTPTAFLRQGSVQTIMEDRIAAARNTLSVASRADLDESLYSAVNSAVSQMENARTARDISRANQLLTTAVSELTASASTSALSDGDRKSLSRAADDFTEQGSFLRQEAKTYNEKADKALRVYGSLPTRFLLSEPDYYEGL